MDSGCPILLVSSTKKICVMSNELVEKGTEQVTTTSQGFQAKAPSPAPSPPMGERENSAGAGFYRHAGPTGLGGTKGRGERGVVKERGRAGGQAEDVGPWPGGGDGAALLGQVGAALPRQ